MANIETCTEVSEVASTVMTVMRDEMYPNYNFLKRRLLSVYPRFKAVIDNGELTDLIPDGMKLLDNIDKAQAKLQGPPVIYITGNTAAVAENFDKNLIVSSKGSDENIRILKKSISELEFRTSVKSIAETPSLIVNVVEIHDNGDKPVDLASSEAVRNKAFSEAARNMVLLLPMRDRSCCVLCTEGFDYFSSLDDFNINGNFSELNSMSKLIQKCLEEKAVRILHMIQDLIKKFQPDIIIEGSFENEPLAITVTRSLHKSINESSLKQEMDEVGAGRGFEYAMSWYICRNLETMICQNLSKKYMVTESVAHEFLYKVKFDEHIKLKVERDPEVFKKSPQEIQLFYKDFAENISDDLERFQEEIENTFPLITKVLPKIDFEINGIFRQARLPNSAIPTVPKNLKSEILRMDGVYGCGMIYGNLAVHVKEAAHLHDITDKIKCKVKELGRQFLDRLEVTPVSMSVDAGPTYESGKSLRVKRSPGQDNDNVGENLIHNQYSFGTLGCFVKGKYANADTGNYTENLYALSCAHVFPEGCDNAVEVSLSCSNFHHFGTTSPEFMVLQEHTIDIAAILVESTVLDKCNVRLKNISSMDGWESELYKGELSDLEGSEVFKWGSVSDLTQGLIISHDYHLEVQALESLDESYNVLIGALPGLSDDEFSKKGDSGTVVCYENPNEQKVTALSMINGAAYRHGQEGTEKKYLCSYSCHLHKNVQELSRKTNINFKWYDQNDADHAPIPEKGSDGTLRWN